MQVTEANLQHSTTMFHDIVPGRQASSLGSITLDVSFGTKQNYRKERIWFEVVPFKSAYHAIFGRPACAKFMARPCYIYSKLKIPGPNGIITVSGDFKKAKECERGNAVYAEAVISAEELEEYKKEVNPKEMPAGQKPPSGSDVTFKASKQTKKVKRSTTDSTKETAIGAGLERK